jgi:predicted nucleic acid-binding Zn ribbon protein
VHKRRYTCASPHFGTEGPSHALLQMLRDLDIFYAPIPDNDRKCLETVSLLLAERITRGVEGCSGTLVAACSLSRRGVKEGGPMEFFFGEDPPNLIAAGYTQFASLIANKVPFEQCEGCGTLFTPKHGKQRYCSKQCSDRTRQRRRRPKES